MFSLVHVNDLLGLSWLKLDWDCALVVWADWLTMHLVNFQVDVC